MPSNLDIIKLIGEVANAAGVDVPETQGKNNAQLASVLKNLKTLPPADEPEVVETPDEPEVVETPEHCVAPGKSIISKRGILAPGEEVKVGDFEGGEETIQAFIKSGHIIQA